MTSSDILADLDSVLATRKQAFADSSYVAKLYAAGLETILKKLAEENLEIALAAQDNQTMPSADSKEDLLNEVCDYWFHSLVLLHQQDLNAQMVLDKLTERFGLSGLDRVKPSK